MVEMFSYEIICAHLQLKVLGLIFSFHHNCMFFYLFLSFFFIFGTLYSPRFCYFTKNWQIVSATKQFLKIYCNLFHLTSDQARNEAIYLYTFYLFIYKDPHIFPVSFYF